jgi:DNA (cytosine-5)-methyltransferase 1
MTALRVVDLFAGAGGLSLGFEQAGSEVDGVEVVLAVESNAKAVCTYQANHPGTVVLHETISKDWDVVERLKEHLGPC